jgi:signal peptidase II
MRFLRQIAALFDPGRPVGRATMIWIAAATVAADQATKWWAVARLRQGAPIVLLPNFLELRFQVNTGAAFSMFEGHTGWLALFSALISVGLLTWGWLLPARERGLRLPFGLILGGAVGNLIDRVWLRHVIDFIVAHWHQYYWPTFNVADSAVCIGMAWLILASFRGSPQPSEAKSAASAK